MFLHQAYTNRNLFSSNPRVERSNISTYSEELPLRKNNTRIKEISFFRKPKAITINTLRIIQVDRCRTALISLIASTREIEHPSEVSPKCLASSKRGGNMATDHQVLLEISRTIRKSALSRSFVSIISRTKYEGKPIEDNHIGNNFLSDYETRDDVEDCAYRLNVEDSSPRNPPRSFEGVRPFIPARLFDLDVKSGDGLKVLNNRNRAISEVSYADLDKLSVSDSALKEKKRSSELFQIFKSSIHQKDKPLPDPVCIIFSIPLLIK